MRTLDGIVHPVNPHHSDNMAKEAAAFDESMAIITEVRHCLSPLLTPFHRRFTVVRSCSLLRSQVMSLSGQAADPDVGFEFRDFCLLFCKAKKRALPAAIAATVDTAVWDDASSAPRATDFIDRAMEHTLRLVSGQGWFYSEAHFEREEHSRHEFSLLGWAGDVADVVVLEAERDTNEQFDAYSRIATLFIAVAIFTISWWVSAEKTLCVHSAIRRAAALALSDDVPGERSDMCSANPCRWVVPLITVFIIQAELRLDMWRLTRLQVKR